MGRTHGTVTGTSWIQQAAAVSHAWHLAIVAEGYTHLEMGQFAIDADYLAQGLLATAPFNLFANKINILRLDVESDDSGADQPSTCSGVSSVWVDTYFDATFCTNGIERLLTVDTNLVRQTFREHRIAFHDAIVLVNSTDYGGSGEAQIAVCSKHTDALNIALHELGHSAFDLGEEYTEGFGLYSGEEPFAPNNTIATTLAGLKWKAHVPAGTPIPTFRGLQCSQHRVQQAAASGTIGTFEGADRYDCGLYSPSAVCKMRDRSSPFCTVCAARIADKLSAI